MFIHKAFNKLPIHKEVTAYNTACVTNNSTTITPTMPAIHVHNTKPQVQQRHAKGDDVIAIR